MKSEKKTLRSTISSDKLMKEIYGLMADDLSSCLFDPVYQRVKQALREGTPALRSIVWPDKFEMPIKMFKAQYQLEAFNKRYVYEDDMFTDEDRSRFATEKFVETQIRCARPLKIDSLAFRALQRARKVMARILGPYDRERHIKLCRFGKRACVGVPYRDSYLDTKASKRSPRPFTGSDGHLRFYEEAMSHDETGYIAVRQDRRAERLAAELDELYLTKKARMIRKAYQKRLRKTAAVRTLRHTSVPKNWKIARGMMPDTIAGTFYTAGLGCYITEVLKEEGLNIASKQAHHRVLVRSASETKKLVTADLSSASDSITLELLRRLCPTKWYQVITLGRVRNVEIEGSRCLQLSSFATMGLGHTFPLQTLLFYCLLKGIAEECGGRHFVSVYGDDLIYSSHLHKYVKRLFPQLHLLLNEEKTYVETHFRESCGSDCYRGVDVRPFNPEGRYQDLAGLRLASFLYRIYNGLVQRWGDCLPTVYEHIFNTIFLYCGPIDIIPPSFPDNGGVRVDRPWDRSGDVRFRPVGYDLKYQAFMTTRLDAKYRYRPIFDVRPYLWDNLRQMENGEDAGSPWDDPCDSNTVALWCPKHRKPVPSRKHKSCCEANKIWVVVQKGSSKVRRCTTKVSTWL